MVEVLLSPVKGKSTELENVNDDMFAQKMLGDGIAVIPSENEFYSPIDGTVTMVFETQHAIGIETKNGVEVLIHIGLETMSLNGKPFQTKVHAGDCVKAGDLLTIVDWSYIRKKGLDVIVPIIVTNKKVIKNRNIGLITVGDNLFEIDLKG